MAPNIVGASSTEKKPYDVKDLAKRLRKRGINVAEEAAEALYEELKGWFKESAALSPTPVDDIVATFLPQLDKIVEPALDKIDGETSEAKA